MKELDIISYVDAVGVEGRAMPHAASGWSLNRSQPGASEGPEKKLQLYFR